MEDDIPEISISGGGFVDEGQEATFTIYADIDREVDIELQYALTGISGKLLLNQQLQIKGNSS